MSVAGVDQIWVVSEKGKKEESYGGQRLVRGLVKGNKDWVASIDGESGNMVRRLTDCGMV